MSSITCALNTIEYGLALLRPVKLTTMNWFRAGPASGVCSTFFRIGLMTRSTTAGGCETLIGFDWSVMASRYLPADGKAVPQDQIGEDVGALGKRPRLIAERLESEEGVVDRGLRRGAGPIDQRIQRVLRGPPAPDGVGQPVAGVPHVGMLAGVDLVVDTEHVQVGLGAQVEHPQVPCRDQSHQLVVGVVGGNHQAGRPVALAEGANQSACGITRSECPGLRVEAVAGGRNPGPAPLRR